jgi:hypothetical protein
MTAHVLMGSCIVLFTAAFLRPAWGFGQSQLSPCHKTPDALEDCVASGTDPVSCSRDHPLSDYYFPDGNELSDRLLGPAHRTAAGNFDSEGTPRDAERQSFHWGRALTESFTFLVIEQAYVVHTDFRWVVSQNGIPFNHYWRDYRQSLSSFAHSCWNDGDPNWFGYVGHPIQGALTGFIQIQNDLRARNSSSQTAKPTDGIDFEYRGAGITRLSFAIVSPMSRSRCSQFFPVGQRHQLVENFLQSLEPTFVIPRFARYLLLAAMGVLAVRFTDLRYFFSQFHDAVFNGILHDDRLAERKAPESIQIWS